MLACKHQFFGFDISDNSHGECQDLYKSVERVIAPKPKCHTPIHDPPKLKYFFVKNCNPLDITQNM